MLKRNKKNKAENTAPEMSDAQQFAEIIDEVDRYKTENQEYVPSSSKSVTQLILDNEYTEDTSPVINIGVASHIGTRPSQQDSLIIGVGNTIAPEFNGKFIAAVCDGMGGLKGGEKASALCAKIFYEEFFSTPMIADYPKFYKNLIDKIDAGVSDLRGDGGELLKAGSTFVSIIVDFGKLYWGCVGDSHMYIIRNNEIVQVNRDHNYMLILNEQVKKGEITQDEANSNKHKDALISYMGMNGVKYMDVNESPFILLPEDVVVLCSDGLYRLLSDYEILEIINASPSNMTTAANALVDAACDKMAHHQDNTSVIIFKYI